MKRLQALALRLAALRHPHFALEAILDAVLDVHNAQQGQLVVLDRPGGRARVAATRHLPPASVLDLETATQPSPEGLCLRSGQRVIVEDMHEDDRFSSYIRTAEHGQFRAVHCTPILSRGGETLGVISVHFSTPCTPTDREIHFADLCALLAADAMEAAHAADTVRQSARQMRRVLDSSEQFMALLDAEGNLIEANSTSLAFAGLRQDAEAGRPYWQTVWWTHSPEVQEAIQRAVETARSGTPARIETTLTAIDGRTINVDLLLKPVRDRAGRICNLLAEAHDITDRKRIEATLKEARDAAEAANRAKDRFLAMLSHELRTPLSPVLALVAGLESDPYLPERFRGDLTTIRRNIELEAKLIDDLLDLSRIIGGKLRLSPERVDLNQAMRQVCAICRPQILEKQIRFQLDLDPKAGDVLADPARLQQVMWNLLKNAVKFTPDNGTIRVSTFRLSEGRAGFDVRDSGIGIAAEALERIFDAFEQETNPATRKHGGLGLGLAISRSLVEGTRGTIAAFSDGPGKGALFRVELPAAERPAESHQYPQAPAPPAPAVRILLVEDHVDTAAALARLLESVGFCVKCADCGAQALQFLAADAFDIVMSDLGLPDITGHELMRLARQRWNIVGIAMSGYGMDEDIRKSLEAGFSEHLVKPVKLAQLKKTIERVARHVRRPAESAPSATAPAR